MNTRMTGHKSRTFQNPLEQINRRRVTEYFPDDKPKRKPTPKCVNQSAGFSARKKNKK
jgi:hypothetical protein